MNSGSTERRLKGGGRPPGARAPARRSVPPGWLAAGLLAVALAGVLGYVGMREWAGWEPGARPPPGPEPGTVVPEETPPPPVREPPPELEKPLTLPFEIELPPFTIRDREKEETPPAPVGITRAAVLVERVQPEYPRIAQQARMEGRVELRVTVGTDGTVADVTVERGNPILGRAAADAVRKWRYEPALDNGVPVEAVVTVTVNFTLGGGR